VIREGSAQSMSVSSAGKMVHVIADGRTFPRLAVTSKSLVIGESLDLPKPVRGSSPLSGGAR
jgi:hypothetical protein